jgi:CBS domain-containing protein
MKVQDVMTKDVKSCRPETNLAVAGAMMWESDCGALPVVDDAGKVMGMLTDRDIAIAVASRGRVASRIAANEVITGRVSSCASDQHIADALAVMKQEKVRRLPVTNRDGVLQGILSINDIVLHADETKGKQATGLSYEEAMSTLKAICEHHSISATAHA